MPTFFSSVTGSCCGKIILSTEGMATRPEFCCDTLAFAELTPLLRKDINITFALISVIVMMPSMRDSRVKALPAYTRRAT